MLRTVAPPKLVDNPGGGGVAYIYTYIHTYRYDSYENVHVVNYFTNCITYIVIRFLGRLRTCQTTLETFGSRSSGCDCSRRFGLEVCRSAEAQGLGWRIPSQEGLSSTGGFF